MQTFLPHPSFIQSASVLDRQRLGKQRVEAYQILRTLLNQSEGWKQHPAVKMWRGYELALCHYGIIICREWISRGYRDSLKERFEAMFAELHKDGNRMVRPPWLDDPSFCLSHQSNLIRKDPDFYHPRFPDIPDNLPYVWPK